MKQILHDTQAAVWAYATNHPNAIETRLQIGWPLSIRRMPQTGEYAIRFKRPYFRIATPYEVETAYLSQ